MRFLVSSGLPIAVCMGRSLRLGVGAGAERHAPRITRCLSVIPLLIRGKEVYSSSVFDETSPHKTLLHRVHSAEPSHVEAVCEGAEAGFREWSALKWTEKGRLLRGVITHINSHRDQLIRAQTDIGVPRWFANVNVDGSVGQLENYIGHLADAQGTVEHTELHELAMVVREPLGVVLSITPWNAPGLLNLRALLAPLAAGNAVILKPSERSSMVAHLFAKCFVDAGLPAGVVSVVHASLEDTISLVERLIAHPSIKKVNFTGSTAVGATIAATAGRHLKPLLLELGGKNCVIVTKDVADQAKCATTVIWSSWAHRGQICMSTERVLVHESAFEAFVETVRQVGTRMCADDTDLTISQRDEVFTERVVELISEALAMGATSVLGPFDGTLKPTVLTGVTPEMALYHTESFGPVFILESYTTQAEVIATVNGNHTGLKCGIWCDNHLEALAMARQIQAGGVHINSSTVSDEATLAHGGVKASGYGRFNGVWGIAEFSYLKTITCCR